MVAVAVKRGKRGVVDRELLIAGILAAARKPVPQIVPRVKLLCSDGQWRYPLGIPWGVTTTGEKMTSGYAYLASNGTTYGTLWTSVEAGVKAWEANQDKHEAEFRQILEAASDDELQSHADYWLK